MVLFAVQKKAPFVVWTHELTYMLQSSVAFAVAAHELQVEFIVGLTQWLSSLSHPSLLTRHHWLTDHLLPMIPGVAHTTINLGLFAEVITDMLPPATRAGCFGNCLRSKNQLLPQT